MIRGRDGHAYTDDELGKLAGAVVCVVRPNSADRETREDCWQAAYVAGLEARRSAARSSATISRQILFLKMQSAVYRLLRKPRVGVIVESDLICR